MAKIDTQFMTLWGRTYLYSPYDGVPPHPGNKQTPKKLHLLCFAQVDLAMRFKKNSLPDEGIPR